MYRVRKSFWRGTCVLQTNNAGQWEDCYPVDAPEGAFEVLTDEMRERIAELEARVARYERRAAGQRLAKAKREEKPHAALVAHAVGVGREVVATAEQAARADHAAGHGVSEFLARAINTENRGPFTTRAPQS